MNTGTLAYRRRDARCVEYEPRYDFIPLSVCQEELIVSEQLVCDNQRDYSTHCYVIIVNCYLK